MITVSKPKINSSLNTNDKDLAKMAGYNAYEKYANYHPFYIHDKQYWVVNTSYDNPTGLDAFTVKNVATGEYTVIFQGTNPKQLSDLLTDVNLLGDVEPDQLKAASHYFDQMNRKYGVSSVCGNSLGGALANVSESATPK